MYGTYLVLLAAAHGAALQQYSSPPYYSYYGGHHAPGPAGLSAMDRGSTPSAGLAHGVGMEQTAMGHSGHLVRSLCIS